MFVDAGVQEEGEYSVKITAVSPYAKTGETIEGKFTVKADWLAIHNSQCVISDKRDMEMKYYPPKKVGSIFLFYSVSVTVIKNNFLEMLVFKVVFHIRNIYI